MIQRVRPVLIGSGAKNAYRFAYTLPTPGAYTFAGAAPITTNLGITWANASDHTQPLLSPPWDFQNGYSYQLDDDSNFYPFKIKIVVGTGQLALNGYVVDKTGVDLFQTGTISFVAAEPTGGISAGAGQIASGAGCGVRWELVYSTSGGNAGFEVTLPATVRFIGAPSA